MSTPPLTRSIGSAERTMRALLEHVLANKHLSFTQWTALVFTSSGPLSTAEIVQRQLAGHVVSNEPEARQAVEDLIGMSLLTESPGKMLYHTEEGRDLFASLSKSIEQITGTLFGDLPQADLEVTHRTLLEIALRANKILATKSFITN